MNKLSNQAQKTLNRLGDIMCPRNDDFPSYSELGAIEFVDGLLQYAPEKDIKDLNMLLAVLAVCPTGLLRGLVKKMNNSHNGKGGASILFRQLDFGIKGIVFSTYYCGKRPSNYKGKLPTEIIDFSLDRIEDE